MFAFVAHALPNGSKLLPIHSWQRRSRLGQGIRWWHQMWHHLRAGLAPELQHPRACPPPHAGILLPLNFLNQNHETTAVADFVTLKHGYTWHKGGIRCRQLHLFGWLLRFFGFH